MRVEEVQKGTFRLSWPDVQGKGWCHRSGEEQKLAAGGIRISQRPWTDDEGRRAEACFLARSMELKNAWSGLECDGIKVVLPPLPKERRKEVFQSLGRWFQGQGGRLHTAGDLGTTQEDLDWMGQETEYVHCATPSLANAVSETVEYGLEHGLQMGLIPSGVRGRALVQGAGAIGTAVIHRLLERHWDVLIWDTHPDVRAAWSRDSRVRVVTDLTEGEGGKNRVFFPCAVGGLFEEGKTRLSLPVFVCGGANRILQSRSSAAWTHQRGCWIFPSVLSSAGAVIQGMAPWIPGGLPAEELMRLNRRRGKAVMEAAFERNCPPWVVTMDSQPDAFD